MQERPDPAVRRRRITRGRAIAAALSVGSAVALTAAIAVTDDVGASASPTRTRSQDTNATNPGSTDRRFGGPSQADPFSGGDAGDDSSGYYDYSGGYDDPYSGGNGGYTPAPTPLPDTSQSHTSSRGS